MNNHSYAVDFLSASLIICICLIVLLPKVHESFSSTTDGEDQANQVTQHQEQQQNVLESSPKSGLLASIYGQQYNHSANSIVLSQQEVSHDILDQDTEHHDHHHKFPTGEFLICVGFFVFYSTGLALTKPRIGIERFLPRRQSAVCCSSIRCPSSQQPQVGASTTTMISETVNNIEINRLNEQASILAETDKALGQPDCVLLLNRHHNHHTHNRHHEHQQTNKNKRVDYGATQRSIVSAPSLVRDALYIDYDEQDNNNEQEQRLADTTIVVDEIRITSIPCEKDYLNWPLSIKMLIFSLILASFLIFFDVNVLGIVKTIKVFRAASTGALLYIAFFMMLPMRPVGCDSCKQEES